MSISIHFGVDHCWSFVEKTVERGAPWEPAGLATKLGCVFSGSIMIMSKNDDDNTVNLTATHVLFSG